MRFLNPSFLYFLPLALLPVLLHLLGRRLERKRYFSWIKLLISAEAEGRRRRRLFELLILALRILVIACLVLALSAPIRVSFPPPENLIVDVSGSMKSEREKLIELIRKLKKSFRIKRVVYFADRILEGDSLRIYDLGTDFSVLNSLSFKGNTLILSDFQKSGFKGDIRIFFRPYLFSIPHMGLNTGVELEPVWPFFLKGGLLKVRLFIINKGTKRDVRGFKIIDGGKVVFKGEVDVEPKDTIEKIVTLHPKTGRLEAVLEGRDEYPGDDTFYLMVPSYDTLNVLMLGRNRYVEKALKPEGVETPFNLRRREKLDDYETLRKVELVILLKEPSEIERGFLRRFIDEGGRLLSFYYTPFEIKYGEGEDDLIFFKGERVNLGKFRYFERGELKTKGGKFLKTKGDGYICFGFLPDGKYTDFVYKASFVPFLIDVVRELMGEGRIYEIKTGESLRLNVEEMGIYYLYKGNNLIGRFKAVDGTLNLYGFYEPGFYEVKKNFKSLYFISVNSPEEEGELMEEGELSSKFSGVTLNNKALENLSEFSTPLTIFALLFLILEMLLLKVREK